MRATTIDFTRNEAKATVSGFSFFALGGVIESELTWIDFGYSGIELGTITMPFNTMAEDGTIRIKGDTGTPSTSEAITIVRQLRIEADGGPVRIGD